MNQKLTLIVAAAVLLGAAVPATLTALAQERMQQELAQHQEGPGGMDFTVLTKALQSTPGCLGVEVAQFQSGQLSIFAWFEDKAAALRWYNHPMHRGAKGAFFPEGSGVPEDYVPLAHIKDEQKPLMIIATITPSREQQAGGPPISQISIELYQPVPGGLAIAGRLAPSGMDVQHMSTRDRF
jgi:hypothetical protein